MLLYSGLSRASYASALKQGVLSWRRLDERHHRQLLRHLALLTCPRHPISEIGIAAHNGECLQVSPV